jgi:uncharacterized membrane protein
MTQDEINQAEWEDPDNWSDGLFGVYFSKRDTRVLVPKRGRRGWTLNLGQKRGSFLFVFYLLLPSIVIALMGIAGALIALVR